MVATFLSSGLRRVRIGICALLPALLGSAPAFAAPSYDFAYRVSGDRRVAPQQVFDDGASTYLQFYPGQVLPALIAVASDGSQRLLTHAQLGPYVSVPGTHVGLVAQLGNVRAVIDYGGKVPRVAGDDAIGLPALPAQPAAPVAAPAGQGVPFAPPWASAAAPVPTPPAITVRTPAVAAATSAPASPAPSYSPPAPATRSAATATSLATPLGVGPARDLAPTAAGVPTIASVDAVTVAEAWPLVAAPAPAKPFEATLADQNLRRALGRWATQAGWTFRAEHWTPDIDIAVSAPAMFGADFKAAVRGLLAGTELSARPLQPCFYANLVLRVIAQAERCDRRVAH
jgi:hypothetical protein